jgi:hypothetical protein
MMKRFLVTLSTLLLLSPILVFGQKIKTINLHDAVKNNKIMVYNREMTLIDEEGYEGIRLSKAFGEGIAWLKAIDFTNGTIEFDVRGEDVKQHSFVGMAFHAQNDSTFEAIYLRPFQFKAQDSLLRSHGIQYISLPAYTWRKLRSDSPGTYEHSIDPAPDPNGWVHVRIVVMNENITTYINRDEEPTLEVRQVTPLHSGSIGFYVADTSGGDFANIRITQ